ncbi:MAG: dihydroorotase [Chitinophagales bacterium]
MEILIRSARIIDAGSPYNNQVKDILISEGKIKKIGAKLINNTKAQEVKLPNLHVSLGWVDLHTYLSDPGLEQKETVESGCRAAAFGGFTHICAMPNTNPVTDTKAQVEYLLRKSAGEIVTVLPVGAATQHTDGKDLADMYDMHLAGAVAFSDGLKPSPSAGVIERALLYIKAFDGLLMVHPEDKSISKNGAMQEGVVSTRLGLPGAAPLAEEIAVNRDLYVQDYTQGRLHFLDVSLKKSIELIRGAKKKGQQVTCSVNAYNLLLDDSAVGSYDTNCKVNPHLRSKEDIAALIKGIADGTVDTVTSAHNPQDEDCKKLEFDKADFGMIGLETAFAVTATATTGKIKTEQLVALFAENPRKVLGLQGSIKEGALADLTLFDPEKKWTFSKEDIKSLSANTPFIGTAFTGKALGVVNKGLLQLN